MDLKEIYSLKNQIYLFISNGVKYPIQKILVNRETEYFSNSNEYEHIFDSNENEYVLDILYYLDNNNYQFRNKNILSFLYKYKFYNIFEKIVDKNSFLEFSQNILFEDIDDFYMNICKKYILEDINFYQEIESIFPNINFDDNFYRENLLKNIKNLEKLDFLYDDLNKYLTFDIKFFQKIGYYLDQINSFGKIIKYLPNIKFNKTFYFDFFIYYIDFIDEIFKFIRENNFNDEQLLKLFLYNYHIIKKYDENHYLLKDDLYKVKVSIFISKGGEEYTWLNFLKNEKNMIDDIDIGLETYLNIKDKLKV